MSEREVRMHDDEGLFFSKFVMRCNFFVLIAIQNTIVFTRLPP